MIHCKILSTQNMSVNFSFVSLLSSARTVTAQLVPVIKLISSWLELPEWRRSRFVCTVPVSDCRCSDFRLRVPVFHRFRSIFSDFWKLPEIIPAGLDPLRLYFTVLLVFVNKIFIILPIIMYVHNLIWIEMN